ncbi:MAG: hypothetical protein RIR62_2004 [Pseudomonadota bacterium]
MRSFLSAVLALVLSLLPATAQELSALARLDPARSFIGEDAGAIVVELGLSQSVPWRVRVLDGPPRAVIDFREVDWQGIASVPRDAGAVTGLRAGTFRPGWSRLVLALSGPFTVASAAMETAGPVTVRLRLVPASAADFAAAAALPEPAGWTLPDPAAVPPPVRRGDGPLVVVLDPGHGGIDPGAERAGETEANLMLTFARELKEVLIRDGNFDVVMTRNEDVFVPLETRISIARAAAAHVMVSLHADALAEGEAEGATIYTLSEDATDEAARALAERHDRDDLLSGVDLSAQDDLVATVLMDMARTETQPRVDRLAVAMESAIKGAGLKMHRRPIQSGGFSVLKSPDIPSILIEAGFMSSPADLERLRDPAWRAQLAGAIRDGLKAWAREDAGLSALRWQ